MSPTVEMALILAGSAACIAGLVVWAARLDGNGGHTHRNAGRRAAVPFADPADRDDRDGEGFIRDISAGGKPGPDLDALPPGDDPADLTWGTTGGRRWLGMPSRQYVDELFDKHAEADR